MATRLVLLQLELKIKLSLHVWIWLSRAAMKCCLLSAILSSHKLLWCLCPVGYKRKGSPWRAPALFKDRTPGCKSKQLSAVQCSLKQKSEGWFHFSKGPRLIQGRFLVMCNSRNLVWMSKGGLLLLLPMENNFSAKRQWPHIALGVWRTSASWRGGARLILSYWHRKYGKTTANRPYHFSFSARKTDLFRENLSFKQQAEVR